MLLEAATLFASTHSTPRHEAGPAEAELLFRHDDLLGWEEPTTFDRPSALRDFRRFVAHLEEVLGRRIDHEAYASQEEARFHAEVFLSGGPLRFSNFGRMVAFAEERKAPDALVRTVEKLLREHGYQLIARSELEKRYTGKNPRMGAGTWFDRFFG